MTIAEMNEPFAKGINLIIAQKKLKKTHVAEKAGYPSQQLVDMLNGRKIIKPCNAVAIAEALGVTMNDICEAGKKG